MPTLATTDSTWVNSATVSYDAAELRRADAAIFASGGIASGLVVTVNASDVVTVTAGQVVIDGESTVAGTGVYRGGIGANATVALDARDATNSRVDLVVARQYDPDVVPAHTSYGMAVEVITGTPAASPSAPALPDLAVELARITVPASGGGAASVDATNRPTATSLSSGADPWSEYAPTWKATSTNPSRGNGSIGGRYMKIGQTVHFRISLAMGSTTTYGAGVWTFSLPFTAQSAPMAIGSARLNHGSTNYAGSVYCDAAEGGDDCRVLHASGSVTTSAPWTWEAGDSLQISGTYEASE